MGFCDWLLRVAPNGKSSRSSRTLVILLIASLLVHKGGGEECGGPLGMESGKITSSQITASSSFDLKSVGPQNARIRKELEGGAWCPKSVIQRDVREFIEVDLLTEHRITATETQGRFGNGVGREFTEKLTFEFWRARLGKWVEYRDSRGRTIFDGNGNTYTGVKQELVPPIFASKLRFIPHSIHPRTVCMRVEVYGCLNEDGIVSYNVPQGYTTRNLNTQGDAIDFRDSLYDGQFLEESESGSILLFGGRGMLTDGVFGAADFTQSKVNGWMGWRNESTPIKIQFHFERLRKFEAVKVHVSNLLAYNAQVFASVRVAFSVNGGAKLSKTKIVWTPQGKNESGGSVLVEEIPLRGLTASFILLEFVHSNKWLLISEISFVSVPADNEESWAHSEEVLHSQVSQRDEMSHVLSSSKLTTIVGVVIGCVSVCLVLSTALALCFLRRRNGRNTKLIGIIGMPTPKSMSVGHGLNNTNSTTSGSSGGSHISTISGNTSNRGELKDSALNLKQLSMQQRESERKISLFNKSGGVRRERPLGSGDLAGDFLQDIRLKSESAVGKYDNLGRTPRGYAGEYSVCGGFKSVSANCAGGGGSGASSCTSTTKTTGESDSSSSSGYASTFTHSNSQQLRRNRSSENESVSRERQSNGNLQMIFKGDSNSANTSETNYYRHLSSRLHPKISSSVSSPVRTASSLTSRPLFPHEYSNASTVSYLSTSKLNFIPSLPSSSPDILPSIPSSHRLGVFGSPQRDVNNKRRLKKPGFAGVATISGGIHGHQQGFRNSQPQDEFLRRASNFYLTETRGCQEVRSASENGFYAVSDVLQSNSYHERRF